jgi:hypothetical protein
VGFDVIQCIAHQASGASLTDGCGAVNTANGLRDRRTIRRRPLATSRG